MFKFLKSKLKKSVDKLSEDIEREGKEEEVSEEKVVEEEKKKGFFSKLFKKKEKVEEKVPEEYEPEELFDEEKVDEDIEEEYREVVEEAPEQEVTAEKVLEKVKEVKEEVEKPTASELVAEAEKVAKVSELKQEVSDLKKEVEEAVVEHDTEKVEKLKEEVDEVVEETEEVLGEIKKQEELKKLEKKVETAKERIKHVEDLEPEEEGSGFFGKLRQKIVTKRINEKQFDELFWDMELVLLENNVAVEVIEKIKNDLKEYLVDRPIRRGKVADTIMSGLRHSVEELFVENIDVVKKVKSKKPYVICFVGINGSGKTTTIAKMCQMFKDNNLKCVMAAADTFRAAAIQQLEEHAKKLNVKLIKHDYGSDAAAVAFDAVKYAEAHHIDVVLIDTAGRMHSNANLVDEMKKIIRVAKPDMKIFVGESITGNDCVEQASKFDSAIGIDGIVLSKADVDDKGGAAVSVSYVTKKPILFIGTGQTYKDLEIFDSGKVIESLEL
ncbi:signal recognition particle-docking protein FtsY [Candidatus Woesearchaeota archaeon]|nr:signal recognition particle-docking protein FtsY [Candidatus Woesearchaeota archaeon]